MINSLDADLAAKGYCWLDGATSEDVASELGRASSPMLLTPKEQPAAPTWSLSGRYGLGAFPWHTDGAISSRPPRWLLLRALELSDSTSTELLQPGVELFAALRRTVLRACDRVNRVRYLPAVATLPDRSYRLRWDPRTCVPRTGLTVDQIERQVASARIEWRQGGLLVIDNSRVLHRRPAVERRVKRILERTYVWSR